jgi:hypothetical protein
VRSCMGEVLCGVSASSSLSSDDDSATQGFRDPLNDPTQLGSVLRADVSSLKGLLGVRQGEASKLQASVTLEQQRLDRLQQRLDNHYSSNNNTRQHTPASPTRAGEEVRAHCTAPHEGAGV